MTPNALDRTDALDPYYNQIIRSFHIPPHLYNNFPGKLMDDPRRQPFLDTIAAEPNNAGHHLVFADWLEEEGDPERAKTHRLRGHLIPILLHPENDDYRLQYADLLDQTGWDKPRAKFIRVQVELQARAAIPVDEYHKLKLREQVLLAAPTDYNGNFTQRLPNRIRWSPACSLHTGMANGFRGHYEFGRGWLQAVTCDAQEWCDHGDTILQEHPVQTVTLTTALPVTMRNDEWDRVTRIFLETTGVGGRRNRFQHGLDQRAFAMTSGNPARMEYFVQDIGMRLLRLAWPRVAAWNVRTPIFQNNGLYWGERRVTHRAQSRNEISVTYAITEGMVHVMRIRNDSADTADVRLFPPHEESMAEPPAWVLPPNGDLAFAGDTLNHPLILSPDQILTVSAGGRELMRIDRW